MVPSHGIAWFFSGLLNVHTWWPLFQWCLPALTPTTGPGHLWQSDWPLPLQATIHHPSTSLFSYWHFSWLRTNKQEAYISQNCSTLIYWHFPIWGICLSMPCCSSPYHLPPPFCPSCRIGSVVLLAKSTCSSTSLTSTPALWEDQVTRDQVIKMLKQGWEHAAAQVAVESGESRADLWLKIGNMDHRPPGAWWWWSALQSWKNIIVTHLCLLQASLICHPRPRSVSLPQPPWPQLGTKIRFSPKLLTPNKFVFNRGTQEKFQIS